MMPCVIPLNIFKMSKNPKISIIIAAYNVAEYLPECLNSVVSQTYDNFEAIIVDDGSTDATSKICDDYAKQYPVFRVVHQKNQGLSAARNRGIKESSGEYLAFVDGDDCLDAYYLEKLFAAITCHHANIAVCGFKTFPTTAIELPPIATMTGAQAVTKLLTEQENYQIVTWNKLYHRTLFQDIDFPIGKIHEDSLTTYKLFATAGKVAFIAEPLYQYRTRQGSIMDKVKLENRLQIKLEAALEAKKYFQNNPKLFAAAEISELLAYFAFLDNIFSGRLKLSPQKYLNWIRENQKRLSKNPYLSQKLRAYIILSTIFSGAPYRFFRKIKH